MHPADIVAAIKKQGKTQKGIADALGVSHSAIAAIIQGRSHSHKIANYIAAVTGLPVGVLWNDQYGYQPKASKQESNRASV